MQHALSAVFALKKEEEMEKNSVLTLDDMGNVCVIDAMRVPVEGVGCHVNPHEAVLKHEVFTELLAKTLYTSNKGLKKNSAL